MGLFKKKNDLLSPEVKESQRFAEKLMRLLSGRKDQGSWVGKDSNWELIFGFLFFFGGIYFLISFLSR